MYYNVDQGGKGGWGNPKSPVKIVIYMNVVPKLMVRISYLGFLD